MQSAVVMNIKTLILIPSISTVNVNESYTNIYEKEYIKFKENVAQFVKLRVRDACLPLKKVNF